MIIAEHEQNNEENGEAIRPGRRLLSHFIKSIELTGVRHGIMPIIFGRRNI